MMLLSIRCDTHTIILAAVVDLPLLNTTLSMHMSPVKPLPATPTKRTLLVFDGSSACDGRCPDPGTANVS